MKNEWLADIRSMFSNLWNSLTDHSITVKIPILGSFESHLFITRFSAFFPRCAGFRYIDRCDDDHRDAINMLIMIFEEKNLNMHTACIYT